jgi:hypothetical protein
LDAEGAPTRTAIQRARQGRCCGTGKYEVMQIRSGSDGRYGDHGERPTLVRIGRNACTDMIRYAVARHRGCGPPLAAGRISRRSPMG